MMCLFSDRISIRRKNRSQRSLFRFHGRPDRSDRGRNQFHQSQRKHRFVSAGASFWVQTSAYGFSQLETGYFFRGRAQAWTTKAQQCYTFGTSIARYAQLWRRNSTGSHYRAVKTRKTATSWTDQWPLDM